MGLPPTVAVIGGGLGGMTAALRLAQRGYKVTLFEQDSYIGGQFRAVPSHSRRYYHEHCYHLFEGWYHNFFSLVGELGLSDRFAARHAVKYLKRGEFPRMTQLKDIGTWTTYLENLTSGPLSIPDMYLFLYSYVDLLASRLHRDPYGEVISVNEFLHTRPYATERSTEMHGNVLLKAFGVPSFQSSAQSYRKFVQFGADVRSPMFYVLKGNVYDNFWLQFVKAFTDLGGEVRLSHRLDRIELGKNNEVNCLHFSQVSASPTLVDPRLIHTERLPPYEVEGSVILAIPPAALSSLMAPELYARQHSWGRVAKLRTEPMASVHLHFNEKFVERLQRHKMRSLPKEPVILLDSHYSITFVDNSRTWSDVKTPYLHVIASDYRELARLDALIPERFTYQARLHAPEQPATRDHRMLDLGNPRSALDHILFEVSQYVPFQLDEVDLDSLEIDSNMHHPIFINEIGSWANRPTTATAFANLFMAGAHCQNAIDITTVEGAVSSGLEAAEAVRCRHRQGAPIDIAYPEPPPYNQYIPLQLLGAPHAMFAKVWSELNQLRKQVGRSDPFSPKGDRGTSATALLGDLISLPCEVGFFLLSELLGGRRR